MQDMPRTITIHPLNTPAGADQHQRVAELVRWGREGNHPPTEVAGVILADLAKYQTGPSA